MRGVRPAIAALACGLAVTLVLDQGAHAKPPFTLSKALFGADGVKAPIVARYAADEDGDAPFVLDRSAPLALLRFDDSSEIWVLTPQPAARGDVIYKNDVGEPVLRATRFGGMTLFTLAHPGGAPAALVSEAPPLRPITVLTPNVLLQRLAQASAHASRAAQRLVVFDAPDVTPQTASLVADAATITAEAIESMARDPAGRVILGKMSRVLLIPGHKAQAVLDHGVLKVVIVPDAGGGVRQTVVSRPSSRRIAMALQH
jgi:Domain of unknown function (DUF4908)